MGPKARWILHGIEFDVNLFKVRIFMALYNARMVNKLACEAMDELDRRKT